MNTMSKSIAGALAVLAFQAGISEAAINVELRDSAFPTSFVPIDGVVSVEFDTDAQMPNLLRIDSGLNLNCTGGTPATPSTGLITVAVDQTLPVEVAGAVEFSRSGGNTLVVVPTLGLLNCGNLDLIFGTGFEDPPPP